MTPYQRAIMAEREEDARQELQASNELRFVQFAKGLDANATCTWAATVTDWETKPIKRRYQTFAEVMVSAMDYTIGPTMTEAMQLILNVAYGQGDQRESAKFLIDQMAATWSYHNTEDV